ncbi:hypothetical protein ACWD2L_06005 [Streptomyces sp. NPDC002754]
MDLAEIQAAIAERERTLKSVRNKIKHRQMCVQREQGLLAELKRKEAELVDSYANLVTEEQRIVRPGSVEDG